MGLPEIEMGALSRDEQVALSQKENHLDLKGRAILSLKACLPKARKEDSNRIRPDFIQREKKALFQK